MALIVEDGTGIEDAESFASVAFADAWLGDRGNLEWAALAVPDKEIWLRQATDYMLEAYRFLDAKLTDAQALPLPGKVIGYPQAVQVACALLADRARGAELWPDTDGQTVKRKREELVGVALEETEYDTIRRPARFPAIDARLAGIAVRRSAGASVKLIR